ncbi:hypothetical protein HDIA_3342 [Hartmannibacter diazotrophicus]|uniref:Uncharacterized protein n=1 Tax=Hartmannibacter diazotrophicus TaxID=1482074 RepID=A0A2C9D9H6_9HYPH|nr:hypothetical protein [Hartmannibacter diazotrophicus]SON56883.1 hypothetical protein HDIA_3342 [Hartmannibacter diazotrophicus]
MASFALISGIVFAATVYILMAAGFAMASCMEMVATRKHSRTRLLLTVLASAIWPITGAIVFIYAQLFGSHAHYDQSSDPNVVSIDEQRRERRRQKIMVAKQVP